MELSIEQSCALQQFEEGDNLVITGEGGSGKTTLIHHLITNAVKRKKKIQICALTGCAALLLECNARTIHSWSGIRLAKGDSEKVINSVFYNKINANNWKLVDILVIDEVSMMSKRIFDILNEIGKRIRKNSKPFGGIQVIFCGDFYQLPPVSSNTEDLDADKFCFESNEWYNCFDLDNHIVLNTIFRQTDETYKRILTNLRKGNMNDESISILKNCVNREYDPEKANGCVPTKLFPTRHKVDTLNKHMFDSINTTCYEYEYVSKKNCQCNMETNVPLSRFIIERCKKELNETKVQNEITCLLNNSSCVKTLKLKLGVVVMCTVNLDMDNGICNGSTGIVEDFVVRMNIPYPIVKFNNGIKREMPIKFWQSEEYPVIAIGQFPICHAWAMTIHKIQGATLSMAEIDIGKEIFEYGQTYVALSRVKSLDGLYLRNFDPNRIKVHPKVTNFYENIPEVEYETEEIQDNVNIKKISDTQELGFESFAYEGDITPLNI